MHAVREPLFPPEDPLRLETVGMGEEVDAPGHDGGDVGLLVLRDPVEGGAELLVLPPVAGLPAGRDPGAAEELPVVAGKIQFNSILYISFHTKQYNLFADFDVIYRINKLYRIS